MRPALRQLLWGGGARPWQIGFNKLKVAAASGLYNVSHSAAMGSPPTVTTSTSIALLSGLTSVQAKWPGSLGNVNLFNGPSFDVGGTYRNVKVAQRSAGVLEQNAAFRQEAQINAAKVGFQINGNSAGVNFRFLIDDVYVSLTGTAPAGASGASYMLLDFTSVGGKASRKKSIEAQANQYFGGFFVAAGDTISAVPSASSIVRCIWAGDSFVGASTGASIIGDGFWMVASDALGIRDAWPSGVGSTGYVNTASGTRFNLGQRITDVTTSAADVVFIEMGVNDLGFSSGSITSEADADIRRIMVALRTSPIFVIGPWDTNAPSAPSANQVACRDAVLAACQGKPGVFFLDPTGVVYSKFDATHPDTAGHATLGAWVNTQVRAVLAA